MSTIIESTNSETITPRYFSVSTVRRELTDHLAEVGSRYRREVPLGLEIRYVPTRCEARVYAGNERFATFAVSEACAEAREAGENYFFVELDPATLRPDRPSIVSRVVDDELVVEPVAATAWDYVFEITETAPKAQRWLEENRTEVRFAYEGTNEAEALYDLIDDVYRQDASITASIAASVARAIFHRVDWSDGFAVGLAQEALAMMLDRSTRAASLPLALAFALAAQEHAISDEERGAARVIEFAVRVTHSVDTHSVDTRRFGAERSELTSQMLRSAVAVSPSLTSDAIRLEVPWRRLPEVTRRHLCMDPPPFTMSSYGDCEPQLTDPTDSARLIRLAVDMGVARERVGAAVGDVIAVAKGKMRRNAQARENMTRAEAIVAGPWSEDELNEAMWRIDASMLPATACDDWTEEKIIREERKLRKLLAPVVAARLPDVYAVALEHERFAIEKGLAFAFGDVPTKRVSNPALDHLVTGIETSVPVAPTAKAA